MSKLFDVRPAEWPRLLMLYGMFFIFVIGYTWSIAILEAVFLRQVGVEFLPWFALIKGLVAIPSIAAYTAFADRVSNKRLLIAILAVGAGGICIGLVLLGLGWVYVAYPLLYLVAFIPLDDILGTHWFVYVSGFYDTRAAKRIIPVLGTALTVASILGGLTMPLINARLSPPGIIAIWLCTVVGMAILAQVMAYMFKDARMAPPPVPRASPTAPHGRHGGLGAYLDNVREGARFVLQSSFLRWMMVSTLLITTLLALLQYQTSQVLLRDLASVERISSFIGILTGVANLAILPVQLFLLSRIIGRIGLGNANLIFPVGTLALSGALVAAPTLPSAALAYFGRTHFYFSIGYPIDSLLYNAVPLSLKGRARAFISGLIAPIGSLVGGTLLLLAQALSLVWLVSALIAALAVACVISALAVRGRYGQALIAMLARDDFSFLLAHDTAKLTAADPATLKELKRRLEESTSADLTIFMANLISEIGGDEAVPILGSAARSAADPRVRAAIVDILAVADRRVEAARQLYTEFLADPHVPVRLSAIHGLEQFFESDNEQYLSHVARMLDDPDSAVRARVLPAHLRAKGASYRDAGLQLLSIALSSQDVNQRVLGVQALGLTGDAHFGSRLLEYVCDPADEVRLEAAIALETLAQHSLPQQLVSSVAEQMRRLVRDPIERVRQAALVMLGHVGTQQTYPVLIDALTDPSPQVREIAVGMLVRAGEPTVPMILPELGIAAPGRRKMAAVVLSQINPAQFGDLIKTCIYGNLVAIYRNHSYLEAVASCGAYSSVVVLRSTLNEQNDRLIDDIFYLLSAIHPHGTVQLIKDSLRSPDPYVRANATEALEALTAPQTASLVSALFDPEVTSAHKLQISTETWDTVHPATAEAIRLMIADPHDSWLRAVAIYLLGEIGAALARAEQPSAQGSDSPGNAADAGVHDGRGAGAAPERRRPRRPPPADLRGRSDGVDRPDVLAAQAGAGAAGPPSTPVERLFTLVEIDRMLETMQQDPADQVQAAVGASRQMQAGPHGSATFDREHPRTLSAVEKIIFLKGVLFFQGMTIDQLKVLVTVCEERPYASGEYIYRQGEPGGALYVIVGGRVGIEQEKRKGSFARVATIEARSYFGEMNLFDSSPHPVSAITIQNTLILRLCREPLIALMRQNPDLSLQLIGVLSQRLREANDRIADLTRTRPRELHRLFEQL